MDNLLTFFGLREDPFRLTPDPVFFFPSPAHQEALYSLEYVVKKREGFCMVTGEPGTGKTTLISVFKEKWRDTAEIALILTPRLSPDDFLLTILEDLKVQPANKNKNEVLKVFKEFLIEKYLLNKYVIIIVDEAQHLPHDTMEELRLLSNLETDKEKLLQIVLIGQPELEARLRHEGLRQLDQRITERIRLRALTREETPAYIEHRLKKAGKEGVTLEDNSVNAIYKFTKGVPRLTNLVLSRTIMAAYIDHSTAIRAHHVTHAIHYLKSGKGQKPWNRKTAYAVTLAAACALLVWSLMSGALPLSLGKNEPPAKQVAARPLKSAATGSMPLAVTAAPLALPAAIADNSSTQQALPPAASTVQAFKTKEYYRVRVDAANVRSEPRKDAPRIGIVYKGMNIDPKASRVDDAKTTWYKAFDYHNGEGWISEEVLEITGGKIK
jgi:type II secretory pathway predicted ATPase ExeA